MKPLTLPGTPGSARSKTAQRPTHPLSPRHVARLEDELSFARSRLANLENSLETKSAALTNLQEINDRLKDRLELFKQQNDENCATAEAELMRVHRELARNHDLLSMQTEEATSKGSEVHRLMSEVSRLVTERDRAISELTIRSIELSQLRDTMHVPSSVSLLNRVRWLSRMEHLEVSAAHFREHHLSSRVWDMLCLGFLNSRSQKKFHAQLNRLKLKTHLSHWNRTLKDNMRIAKLKKTRAQRILLDCLSEWNAHSTRMTLKYNRVVYSYRTKPILESWRMVIRRLKTRDGTTLSRMQKWRSLVRNFRVWQSLAKDKDRMNQFARMWIWLLRNMKSRIVSKSAESESRLKKAAALRREVVIVSSLREWKVLSHILSVRKSQESILTQTLRKYLKHKIIRRWNRTHKKFLALTLLMLTMNRSVVKNAVTDVRVFFDFLRNEIIKQRQVALKGFLFSWKSQTARLKHHRQLNQLAFTTFATKNLRSALDALKFNSQSTKTLKLLESTVTRTIGMKLRTQCFKAWTLQYWRIVVADYPDLQEELRIMKVDLCDTRNLLHLKNQRLSELQEELEQKITSIDQLRISYESAIKERHAAQMIAEESTKKLQVVELEVIRQSSALMFNQERLADEHKISATVKQENSDLKVHVTFLESRLQHETEKLTNSLNQLQSEITRKDQSIELVKSKLAHIEVAHAETVKSLLYKIDLTNSQLNKSESAVSSLTVKLNTATNELKNVADIRESLCAKHQKEMKGINEELSHALDRLSSTEAQCLKLTHSLQESTHIANNLKLELEHFYMQEDNRYVAERSTRHLDTVGIESPHVSLQEAKTELLMLERMKEEAKRKKHASTSGIVASPRISSHIAHSLRSDPLAHQDRSPQVRFESPELNSSRVSESGRSTGRRIDISRKFDELEQSLRGQIGRK